MKTVKSLLYGIARNLWHHALSFLSLPRLVRGARLAGSIMQKYGRTAVRPYGQEPGTQTHSCLANSLLRLYGLQKHGRDARIALGVKKEGGNLLAHAWVEKEGEDFDEQEGFKKLGTL